jgi:hypothetical protein
MSICVALSCMGDLSACHHARKADAKAPSTPQEEATDVPADDAAAYAAFQRALEALPRDQLATLTDAIAVFEAHIEPTSSERVKGNAFAKVYELRETLAETVIEEKYVELESKYVPWFGTMGTMGTMDTSELPPLSKEDKAMVDALIAAGVAEGQAGEGMVAGVLVHNAMLKRADRLPRGARELVSAHRYDRTLYDGCMQEEVGFACDGRLLFHELTALDRLIPTIESKSLQVLMTAQHRSLWDHALKYFKGRPELKTIGTWDIEERVHQKHR